VIQTVQTKEKRRGRKMSATTVFPAVVPTTTTTAGTTSSQLFLFFISYALLAFLLLIWGAYRIFNKYFTELAAYNAALNPVVPTLGTSVNQSATQQNVQAAVNSATAAAISAVAPGSAAAPDLSNPVSASISQLAQITQSSNAAYNIPSPASSADIQTILNYLLARGSRLDGSPWSDEALRVLKNRTPWTCGGTGSQTICTYPAGINTQQTWIIFWDDASGKWNLRVQQ
jgi:hypothetical protein